MKKIFSVLIFSCFIATGYSQFGVGTIFTTDFYQLYINPEIEGQDAKRSSGSAIANIGIGPKIYIGGPRFSVSAEAAFNWGIFALDMNEYKGLGAYSFPLIARLNFGAMSGFANDRVIGFSLGGGVQYNRTEWYYLDKEFEDITREQFRTYVAEVAIGFGLLGFDTNYFFRYGWGEDKAQTFNTGLAVNFNWVFMSKAFKQLDGGSQNKME